MECLQEDLKINIFCAWQNVKQFKLFEYLSELFFFILLWLNSQTSLQVRGDTTESRAGTVVKQSQSSVKR